MALSYHTVAVTGKLPARDVSFSQHQIESCHANIQYFSAWNGRDATGRNRGAMTRDACVDVCAKDGACKFSHYSTSTRVCWTYNQYTGPFNVNWPWDVYMKV